MLVMTKQVDLSFSMKAASDLNELIFGVNLLYVILYSLSLELRNPKSCYLALILLFLSRTIIYFYSLKRLSIAVPAEFRGGWVRGAEKQFTVCF